MSSKMIACAVLAVAGWGCGLSKECTLKGCGPSFSWLSEVPVDPDTLVGTELELCHNDRCLRGPTVSEPVPPGAGVGTSLGENGELDVRIARRSERRSEIEVWWWLRGGEASDGDVFRMTLFGAEGNVLHQSTETVDEYDRVQINGSGCPPTCTTASVDRLEDADD